MPIRRGRAGRFLLGAIGVLILIMAQAAITTASTAGQNSLSPYAISLPVILNLNGRDGSGLQQVNLYRARAGVPAVAESPTLNDNCLQHARYMAENDDLTHEQNPNLPFASEEGQTCARNGNAWLGGDYHISIWEPVDSVEGWITSVSHRLWLLYPTSTRFGFGFYTTQSNRAGAALDVLSEADFAQDEDYQDWPVRYPSAGESGIPATQFPITLSWRYFGPEPALTATALRTIDGTAIPHDANASLPAGHKGIQLIPQQPLPVNSIIVVTVSGTYEGVPFTYTWQFDTQVTADPYP